MATTAGAQDYPNRPISLVVPFPPGGIADITARSVASPMAKILRTPVVVINKPGAGGAVGLLSVATSPPDGHTLALAFSSAVALPQVDKAAGRQPQFSLDQLAPVALITADPIMLLVRDRAPWRTARDFVEDARQRPGRISFASSGVYGPFHLAMEQLAREARISLRHVPYAGVGPALNDVLGGQIEAIAVTPSLAYRHIDSGTLRALVAWGDVRAAALPNVPTFKELGYPGVEFYVWTGMFAPAGTPEPILETLRVALGRVAADGDFRSAMERLRIAIDLRGGTDFRRFIDADARRVAIALGTAPPGRRSEPSLPGGPSVPSNQSAPSVLPLPKESAPSGPSVLPLPGTGRQ